MSFSTFNGVNAARGLSGTRASAPATFGGGPQIAPPPAAPVQPRIGYDENGNPKVATGSSYTMGSGMMGTGRQAASPVSHGSTMAGPSAIQAQNSQAYANGHGVTPGVEMPSAVGPEQQVQFNPNDPNNAALAGYRQY